MYMAGIYRLENGAPVFTILTREPAAAIISHPQRMPVFIPKEAAGDWLNIRYDAGDVLCGRGAGCGVLAGVSCAGRGSYSYRWHGVGFIWKAVREAH